MQALQDKENDYQYKHDNDSYTYIYNFCQNTNTKSDSTLLRKDENGTLVRLSGSIDGEGEDKNQWIEMGTTDEKEGITIALVKGEECKEVSGAKYNANIRVLCDEEVDTMSDFKIIREEQQPCVYTMDLNRDMDVP